MYVVVINNMKIHLEILLNYCIGMLSFHITLTKGQLKAKLQLLPCANPKNTFEIFEGVSYNQKDLESCSR